MSQSLDVNRCLVVRRQQFATLYTKRQRIFSPAMTLVIVISLKTMETNKVTLHSNGVQAPE